MLADLLTVSKSANRNVGKSAGRFSDCQQICQSANLLAEMGGLTLSADLETVTKPAGRFIPHSHQICQSANLLAEVGGDKSAGRFSDCHQICQSVNLLAEIGGKSAGRFSDCHQICWQKWGG